MFAIAPTTLARANEYEELKTTCSAAKDTDSCLALSWENECIWSNEQCQVDWSRYNLGVIGKQVYDVGVGAAIGGAVVMAASLLCMLFLKAHLLPAIIGLLAGGFSFYVGYQVDRNAKHLNSLHKRMSPTPVPDFSVENLGPDGYRPDLNLQHDTVITKLSLSKKPGKRPLIVLLHGSEGGPDFMSWNLGLGERGYHTLGMVYFWNHGNFVGPRKLAKIQIDQMMHHLEKYVEANQDVIDEEKIGILGVSKGGELTLLLASTYPRFKFAVAIVPSEVTFQGLDLPANIFSPVSSWTKDADEIPFVSFPVFAPASVLCAASYFWVGWDKPFLWRGDKKNVRCSQMHELALKSEEAKKAAFPVEKINGPVVMISGTADQFWPSDYMSTRAIDRMSQHNFPHPKFHARFAGDHFAYDPYWPQIIDGIDVMVDYLETGNSNCFDTWTQNMKMITGQTRP